MKLRPVKQASLVDTVVERIRDLIERGELKTGDRLPTEAQLLGQLGVSRTVLREALGRLEYLGLLTIQRGRGMFVGDRGSVANCVKLLASALAIAPRELLIFNEFREGIECIAARRAAECATTEDLADLEALCDAIGRPDCDVLEAMRVDFQFHRRLMAITGNPLMESVLEMIQDFILASMVRTTPEPRDREDSHLRHRAIVEAVRRGDPDAAEQAMHQHMEHTAQVLQAIERQRKLHRA
jgi:GntR family transcriptional repressor for pyruvate dehydrogenase complex